MNKAAFPFWIVTQRDGLKSKLVEVEGCEGFLAAFSTPFKATEFIAARGEARWENRLVSRGNLGPLINEMKDAGLQGLCMDPMEGSTCGKKITLNQLDD